MKFSEWQKLPPKEAAQKVLRGVASLPPVQQRAAIASLPTEAELTARFAAAPRGRPLGGVPYFLKDLFDVAGEATRAGSSFLAEVRPTPSRDGAIVGALREAGAVLVGKTHLHEFAYGLTGQNAFYGDCEHPRFPGRAAGGSSSGAVAVVAAGIAPLSVGTDTGGSVRVPAAFCGLFGFRMTPGDPWIADAFPLAPSCDTAGWFTDNAADMSVVLDALLPSVSPVGRTEGIYLEMPGLNPEVASALRAAAEKFAPMADTATANGLLSAFAGSADAYTVLTSAEAFEVHRIWLDSHRERYSPEVWSRIDRGRHWTPKQTEWARERRSAVNRAWDEYFAAHEFLALAASPFPAPTRAEWTPDSRSRILELTAPASLGGRPVLTVPVVLPSGLTSGIQIVVDDVRSPAIRQVLTRIGP